MGGYLPNPLAVGALKALSYGAVGWAARRRASSPESVVKFALIRVAAGALVGVLFAAAVSGASLSEVHAYLLFQVPRFVVWAALLHLFFRPRGGALELVLWSALGLGVSALTDYVVLHLFEKTPWLRMAFC